jgi:hypothetical protein
MRPLARECAAICPAWKSLDGKCICFILGMARLVSVKVVPNKDLVGASTPHSDCRNRAVSILKTEAVLAMMQVKEALDDEDAAREERKLQHV